jgi:hypothetical protein
MIVRRAEAVIRAFQERQTATLEALAELEKMIDDIIQAEVERVAMNLSPDAFVVYFLLKQEGMPEAPAIARDSKAIFAEYPHWRSSDAQERAVRTKLYGILLKNMPISAAKGRSRMAARRFQPWSAGCWPSPAGPGSQAHDFKDHPEAHRGEAHPNDGLPRPLEETVPSELFKSEVRAWAGPHRRRARHPDPPADEDQMGQLLQQGQPDLRHCPPPPAGRLPPPGHRPRAAPPPLPQPRPPLPRPRTRLPDPGSVGARPPARSSQIHQNLPLRPPCPLRLAPLFPLLRTYVLFATILP